MYLLNIILKCVAFLSTQLWPKRQLALLDFQGTAAGKNSHCHTGGSISRAFI